MANPREPITSYEIGAPLTDRQKGHLHAIREAGELLLECMHAAEGTNPPGEHQEHIFQMRRMQNAALYIEIALMLARKAALETK